MQEVEEDEAEEDDEQAVEDALAAAASPKAAPTRRVHAKQPVTWPEPATSTVRGTKFYRHVHSAKLAFVSPVLLQLTLPRRCSLSPTLLWSSAGDVLLLLVPMDAALLLTYASGASSVQVGEHAAAVGDVVELAAEEEVPADRPPLGLVQALWQTPTGAKELQVRRASSMPGLRCPASCTWAECHTGCHGLILPATVLHACALQSPEGLCMQCGTH